MDRDRSLEIRAVILLALAIIVFLSLSSYTPDDLAFFSSNPNNPYRNQVRAVGVYLGTALVFLLGRAAYLVPFAMAFWAVTILTIESSTRFLIKFLGGFLLFFSSASFLASTVEPTNVIRMEWGGFLGLVFSDGALHYLGKPGAIVLFSTFMLLGLLLTTEFLIMPLLWRMWIMIAQRGKRGPRPATIKLGSPNSAGEEASRRALQERASQIVQERKPPRIVTTEPIPARRQEAQPPRRKVSPDSTGYKLPGLNLLDSPPPISEREIREDLEENSRILEGTLADFGIEARVVQVDRGPVITRYEISPAPGVKVTRITSLSDDIALAMKAPSVRIVAPIPGKAAVGIEVPNSKSTLVYMRELIESKEYQAMASETKLVLALGKDVSGIPIVANLVEMPHLLIAGATGAGKTVCVNALITSLVYNTTPDELKFLMVDPKMVELAPFNGIPHLLCPVVTEHKKAAGALSWVVEEMERRYKEFAEAGVRNITMFNEKFSDKKMFYIIVIIDELADLMLIAQADVENAITRLSQLSRAVGIHIIIATQRPSVDVITGVIKANFPARISFKVASKVDSRTVLDSNGADKLLGKGDMLFLKPGTGKLVRAQGTLIRDNEIEKVVEFIKRQREPQYNEEILSAQQGRSGTFGNLGEDEYYDEAVRMILETGQASTSMLQRRLRLGYTRAARLIDMMEERGVVGSYRGARPREILVNVPSESRPKSADEGSNAA